MKSVYKDSNLFFLSLSLAHSVLLYVYSVIEVKMERHERRKVMTNNQIAYYRAREDERAHRASEEAGMLSARAAASQAVTASRKASEDERAHREQERVNWWSANETARANREREATNWFSAQSTSRLQAAQAEGVLRQAAASERQATASQVQAHVASRNATVNEQNAATRLSELAESIRHSATIEAEAIRHNQQVEAISRAQAEETARANRASESLSAVRNAEQARANRAQEGLSASSIAEQARHNSAGEFQASVNSNRDFLLQQRSLDNQSQQIRNTYEVGSRNATSTEKATRYDLARTIINGVSTANDVITEWLGGFHIGTFRKKDSNYGKTKQK